MHPLIPYFPPVKFDLPFALGPFTAIHGFGIMVALGFMFGAQMAQRKSVRDNIDPDIVNQLISWLVFGVFVGGHLGHALFYEPKEYLAHPIKFLQVWDGLSSFGGFIACTLAVVLFIRSRNNAIRQANLVRKDSGQPLKPLLPIWAHCDALVYGFTLGFTLGRVGCFLAHDHPGIITNTWIGVYGICPGKAADVACFDLGLCEALVSAVMCVTFTLLDRKPRYPGFFAGLWCVMYGPIRLGLDSLRAQGIDTRYFGMTPAQYLAIGLMAFGLWILVRQRKQEPQRLRPPVWTPADAAEASPA